MNLRKKIALFVLTALGNFFLLEAALPPTEKIISMEVKNISMENFLKQIRLQTGIHFICSPDILSENQSISVSAEKESVNTLLTKVLDPLGLDFKVKNSSIIIQKQLKENQITGKVIDENGEVLPGAIVLMQGDSKAAVAADNNGVFTIHATGQMHTLTTSFVGFEKNVTRIKPGKTEYIIRLKSNTQLDEVIVTGIFEKPKVSFTGAATIITKKEIQQSGNRNLLQTISNIDPSFDILENNSLGSDPNRSLNIEIRGSSTIGDINSLQSNIQNIRNLPLFILDGFEVSSERVMDMNQADVESVVILKDASATAIYGSRAANGVMVITSVKPAPGKLRVTYQLGLNLEIPDLSSYNLMNSFEKLEAEQAAGLYTATDLNSQLILDELYNQNLKAAHAGVNTDWIHKPVQTGVGQYHRINIDGGGEKELRYSLNFSYNQLIGAMKGSERKNLNGGMILNYRLEKVRFSNNLTIGLNNAANSTYGQFRQYASMNPYWRAYDENGEPIMSYTSLGSEYPTYNPLYDAAQTSFSTNEYTNIRNTTMIEVDFSQHLRLSSSLGIMQQKGGSDYFDSPESSTYKITPTDAREKGLYRKGNDIRSSYQFSNTISWAPSINQHSFYLGLNSQIMESKDNSTSLTVKGFINDHMNDISNANSYSGERPSTSESTLRSIGVTGILNYNLAAKYFFEASYRLDGASSFGSYSRWAPFWSIGGAWEFGNEKWLTDALPVISSGKLRYSYGVTGSLGFSPYDALTTYQYDKENQYNGLIGAVIIGYGNPKLRWQDTKQHNYGVDVSLANSRFNVSFNYYTKTTDNLLSDVYLPLSHGYTSYKENMGIVKNEGYDALLSYVLIRRDLQQINWSVRAGIYGNKNTLVKLSDAIKMANEKYSGQNASGSNVYEYREGESMDEIYVLKSLGIDPESGKRIYMDEDGTITVNYSSLKKIPVGSSQPKINGRLGTSFRWKGLMIDMNFGCRLGGKKVNSTLLSKVENALMSINQDKRVLSERWKKPGDIKAFKDIASKDATLANDMFVATENTFTFNSLNISYDFPRDFIQQFKMERFSLTASMSDIFYISNIEQERGIDYPYTIKPTFSIACTF